jgi:hypothetical protein
MRRDAARTRLCDALRLGLCALLAVFVIWSVWDAPALLAGLTSLLLGLASAMLYAMFAFAWVVYDGGVIAVLALSPLLVGALIVTVVNVPGVLARKFVAVERSAQPFGEGGRRLAGALARALSWLREASIEIATARQSRPRVAGALRIALYALIAAFVAWNAWEALRIVRGDTAPLSRFDVGLTHWIPFSIHVWAGAAGLACGAVLANPLGWTRARRRLLGWPALAMIAARLIVGEPMLSQLIFFIPRPPIPVTFLNGGFILLACGVVLVIAAALLVEALFAAGLGVLMIIFNRAAIAPAPP